MLGARSALSLCGDCGKWGGFLLFVLFCATAFGQTFTDSRDGKKYRTAKIGEQIWLAENLNYNAEGSKCYDNKESYCDKYGRLYDWETAVKVCPRGWNLPSKSEFEALDRAVGGSDVAATKLKTRDGWHKNGNGTDDFGFSALPGGLVGGVCSPGGAFLSEGIVGYWWSTGEEDSDAYYRYIEYDGKDVYKFNHDKSGLFSVRCIKDKPQVGTK